MLFKLDLSLIDGCLRLIAKVVFLIYKDVAFAYMLRFTLKIMVSVCLPNAFFVVDK